MTSSLLALAALLTLGEARAGACPVELFRLTRSTNANVVAYEAAVAGRGSEGELLEPVWIMLAEDGRREELNGLERALAYGVEPRDSPDPGTAVVVIRAAPGRPLRIRRDRGCLVATTAIAGREAVLRRIHVEADGGLFPSVRSVLLEGVDAEAGGDLREVLSPGTSTAP